MSASVSEPVFGDTSRIAKLLHGTERALGNCGATGWSTVARQVLRIELLTLRANLNRYASAARSDARRLRPHGDADGPSARLAELHVERVAAVPRVLAARLAACGDDREEMYRIRDEFEDFERELRELDVLEDLFPVEPRQPSEPRVDDRGVFRSEFGDFAPQSTIPRPLDELEPLLERTLVREAEPRDETGPASSRD
jgi:hypothetical protein